MKEISYSELPKDIRDKVSILEETAISKLQYLSDLGYRMEGPRVVVSKPFLVAIEYVLKNSAINREVGIDYVPYLPDSNLRSDDIGFSIRSTTGDRRFDPDLDDMVPELLFEKRSSSFDDSQLRLNYYEGEFSERVSQLFVFFDSCLHRYSQGVVEGQDWIPGLIRHYR